MTHVSLAQLRDIRAARTGRRLVLVSGNFNVVHPGHIRLLKFSRSLGDELVVALYPDGQGAYVPQELRLAAMRSLGMVSQAFIILDNIQACIEALKPDIVVKGAEHESHANPESEWLKPWGGRLVFCTDDPRFSLDDVIQGMLKSRGGAEKMEAPAAYMERHHIVATDFQPILDAMSRLNICVVGDLIVDEYVYCNALGMSREDPTLVVSPLEETRFVGGAGIVAGHAAGLGGRVDFVTVAGADKTADDARTWLEGQGIGAHVLLDPDRPTTVKRRYRAQNKTLLRVNRMSQQQIGRERQEEVLTVLSRVLPDADLLIFSDFSYGVLPPVLVNRITRLCRERGIAMAADSQTSSQTGDLGKFHGQLLVTPTELEARQVTRNFTQGLVAVTEALMAETGAGNVIVTLGENGCLIYGDPREPGNEIFTDNLPSFNPRPLDVAGAGDSLLTTAALALVAGADIWRAALLGSIAAGVQVSRMGNVPLTREEIRGGLGLDYEGDR